MRLKAQLWISAYLRICQNAGCPGVVVRHGDDDGGAIYIKINQLDGTSSLYGPAPSGLDAQSTDRRFERLLEANECRETEVDAYMLRQFEFDADLWLVEIEDAKGRHFLEPWLITPRPQVDL